MYEIALTVAACLRAGTRVDVAWAVEAEGFSNIDKSEALALTPGGGKLGGVLSGSLNDQLVDLRDRGVTNRLVRLNVGEFEAQLAGLSCGGTARCLLVNAEDLPEDLWDKLRNREPVCLITTLDNDQAVQTQLYDQGEIPEEAAQLFSRATTDTLVTDEKVITALWPVPKLLIVGAGAISEAVQTNAELLGWHTQVVTQTSAATGVIAGLAVLDKLVVTSHDLDVAGPALAAALKSQVGYIGALGSRRTQAARADWLAYRGITDLDRVHGPAGLDIGAKTPAEIAISILAEAIATRTQGNA